MRTAIEFGRFIVQPHPSRTRRRGPVAEASGGRAFDVLMALIEAGGVSVVLQAMRCLRVSGRTGSLRRPILFFQISALRKAFAADRGLIRTVSRTRPTCLPERSAPPRREPMCWTPTGITQPDAHAIPAADEPARNPFSN